MLGALQLGTTTTVAAAPIANAYFNFDQYFTTVDTFTRRHLDAQQVALTQPDGATATSLRLLLWARLNGLPFPLLATVLPSFAPIAQDFPSDSTVERWEALSPTGIARAITSPTTINHNTADILVPLNQISHRHAYQQMGQSMPEGFSNLMGQDYPGLLSSTLEEQLAPGSAHINYTDVRGLEGEVPMPTTDALVNINVYDDGPPEANASHASVDNRTVIDPLDYLRPHLRRGLTSAETLSTEKLLLLIDRYQGNSLQLPAHRGVSDTTYGSLAVYQREIVDTLGRWSDNHSSEALEAAAEQALTSLQEPQRSEAAETWTRVQDALSAGR